MRLDGPEAFDLHFDARAFTLADCDGRSKLRGRACSARPKLYIISASDEPIYVGVTKQPIRSRLRLGWAADGATGYYGYAWRNQLTKARLLVWYHEDAPTNLSSTQACRDVETVEAEIVYLIRRAGQWPRFQTEIHFHASSEEHRRLAQRVLAQARSV
jgi:hypothetical protein